MKHTLVAVGISAVVSILVIRLFVAAKPGTATGKLFGLSSAA